MAAAQHMSGFQSLQAILGWMKGWHNLLVMEQRKSRRFQAGIAAMLSNRRRRTTHKANLSFGPAI